MTTVIKRNGGREAVSFDKILRRVAALSDGLAAADTVRVAQRVVQGVHDGVTTVELDELAAQTAAALSTHHPDYGKLAARVAVSNLHKQTEGSMRAVFPHLADDVRAFCEENLATLDAALVWARDFQYDYFGFKTLEKSYLLRGEDGKIVERPQVMHLRVACGIHCGDLDAALETYDHLSRGVFTHATPTMFHAGTKSPHLASCFLLPVADDSIVGIADTWKRCAVISKSAGGIGFSTSNVRATGSAIASTGGKSNGLLPMLRVFDAIGRYVDQGGGKRKGAFAAYLEPWHADVRVFLDMKKNHGMDELRARDLFYALWIPDLFMKRVEANATWTLFCPATCPDLVDLVGDAFEARYEEYEAAGKGVAEVKAQDLWFAILDAQIETGTPYMLYKDACNRKSNQQNLGTIRSSNLCTEIVQYSSADEVAVCNLASLALPRFVVEAEIVSDDGGLCGLESWFDHEAFAAAVRVVTRNLNKVIDRNAYPLEEAERSNKRHRPIGLGVQGLADVFMMLDLAYDSVEARALNRDIFETMYYAALDASCALAEVHGPYDSYAGSPASRGELQFDLWGVEPKSKRWDWPALKARVAAHGLRNSLLVAPMPTASTAQILGNVEAFEPITSNLYVRRVLSGEFVVINKHLVKTLERIGMWTEGVRLAIIAGNGSVQHVPGIPDRVKRVYKTAWEMSMRTLLTLAADRGPFVDQSQSLNLFVAAPTHAKLSSMHFYGWKQGLKTGMYYLRTKPAADAVKVTVPVEVVEGCVSCSA
jgi:ribonucleoside-diphosphate reductase alpha subunit